jgi:hypothetical protein
MRHHWQAVSRGDRGTPLADFLAAIAALPVGQLWRHNQAGDLPHTAGRISRRFIRGLTAANRGRRGFTYTHHDLTKGENLALIRQANRHGFRINVSTETEEAADRAIAAGLPAVLAVPSNETRKTWHTAQNNVVLICPAQRSDTKTCANCQLCHSRGSRVIIGFVAHGTAKRKADQAIAAAHLIRCPYHSPGLVPGFFCACPFAALRGFFLPLAFSRLALILVCNLS